MNASGARQILFWLVGLCLLVSFALLLVFSAGVWSSHEPAYQGKSASVWFREFAYGSNTMAGPLRTLGARTLPDGRMVLMQVAPDGRVVTLLAPTNRQAQIAWLRQAYVPSPTFRPGDPAWEALQALGSNAVPCLVRQMRSTLPERAYVWVFTNLPPAIQKKLPDPSRKQWLRVRAIDTVAKLQLGEAGRAATPCLLELLKERDPSLRRAVVNALRSLYVDRRSLTRVLLQLGSQRKYPDVVELAWQTGWEGDDMARLLGEILRSPDPALRREAIALLERSGSQAAPALDRIIGALGDSDKEVRYLAARSLEAIATDTPQVLAALRSVMNDEHVIVRNVARRALTNFVPGTGFPANADSPGQN